MCPMVFDGSKMNKEMNCMKLKRNEERGKGSV
jgi:hypothetical protein